MEKGEDYSKVRNIGLKDKKGNITLNPLRPLIQDLDSLPFQDFDLRNQYIIFEGKNYRMDEAVSERFFDDLNRHGYPIFFTRGCPFSCTYCCNNYFNKLYSGQIPFRKRSVDMVIEELKDMKGKAPFIKIIFFYDDNFFGLSEKEIKDFSEKYKKEINLPFVVVGIHPLAVTREKMASMADAGLFFLKMGVQTGNEKTKRFFQRHYSNSQIEKTAKIIAEFKNKIPLVTYEFIIDNYWENENDIIENLKFLNNFPILCHFDFFSLTFYPGTELYDMAKKEGIIKDEFKEIYQKNYFLPRNTYFNRLFFLIDLFSQNGRKIPPRIFSLLINKHFIEYKLNWPLYFFLYIFIKIWIEIDFREKIYIHGIVSRRGIVVPLINFVSLVWRAIKNKEWFKIKKYIKQKILKINTA
ncbi:MAG: radical SAM protein [Candidatus Pacebacteria bacterium]|nr:radical SAM protein [Candidatus Paceibacterota bacterium]